MTMPDHAQAASTLPARLTFEEVAGDGERNAFERDVADGLALKRKQLPSIYFYDETGSELFEQITRSPEYYLTHAEQSILENYAPLILWAAGPH
mgnify:CR=1 FL=1